MHVLVVCTANLCRSPLAEHLLRSRLTDVRSTITVSSAGVKATPGLSMHHHAAKVLAERGLPVAPQWRSSEVTVDVLAGADVVLTATNAHRDAVSALLPHTVRRSFLLLELAALAKLTEPPANGGPEAALLAASRARSQLRAPSADQFNLADPVGRPLRAFRRCAALIDDSLAPLTEFFAKV